MINHIMAIVCFMDWVSPVGYFVVKKKKKSQKIDCFQSFDNPHSIYNTYIEI